MTLRELLSLEGEELTIEDYESAFIQRPLVDKTVLDKALSDNGALTKEKRELLVKVDTLNASLDAKSTESLSELEKLQKEFETLKSEKSRTEAMTLFVENGYSKETAEAMLKTMDLSNGVENVNGVIDLLNAQRDEITKSTKKEAGKVAVPKTPEGDVTDKKLKERYEKLVNEADIHGMHEFRNDHPEAFQKFTNE